MREEINERAPEVKAAVQDAVQAVGQQVKEKAGRVKEEAKQAVKEQRPGAVRRRLDRQVIGRLLRRRSFLSDREQDLRAREQELLGRLAARPRALRRRRPVHRSPALPRGDRAARGLFLLVIAGEFNSGKSSFINALLGERVLPEGVTPTTDRINLLRHGPQVAEHALEAYLLERTHPAELLRELSVVDTPGTNAIIRRHEELTRDFIPRADLVLFVTSRRPPVQRERARVPGADPRMGQEDRLRR